jgi:hypothetical protein
MSRRQSKASSRFRARKIRDGVSVCALTARLSSNGFTSSQRHLFVNGHMTMFYKEHYIVGTIYANGIAHNINAGTPAT